MKTGVPRLPASPFELTDPSPREDNSSYSLFELLKYDKFIGQHLGIDSPEPFVATPADLEARRNQLRMSRDMMHVNNRNVHQLGMLLVATVGEMRSEFARQTVLDIGSGTGRFGKSIASKTKAAVTFVDKDEQALATIDKKSGQVVVADGKELPFEDESFTKTVVAFSSLTWAETPIESAMAVNEAVRVTEVGGTIFFIPAFSNVLKRRKYLAGADRLRRIGSDTEGLESPGAMKVWASQDHTVLHALLSLIKNNRAAITWQGYLSVGKLSGENIDSWSAIVDKESSVPTEEFEANVAFASGFMAQ